MTLIKTQKKNTKPLSVSTNMMNCKTNLFLQTASANISDDSSKRNYVVKVLLDPGSLQTYISKRIADRLNFTSISQRNMSEKTLGTDKVNYILLNVK